MIFNVPNSLTLLRIGLIPIFVLFFYLPWEWSYLATTVTFLLAGVTDWLDGFLARRWEQTSAFGAFLDPVADKLMVACALILLVDQNPTDMPDVLLTIPATIIVCREIVISALREWMAGIGQQTQVAVSVIGKIKTTAQMTAIILLLYKLPVGPLPTADIGFVLLYVAAGLTLWSMFIYLKAAWPKLNSIDTK